MDMLLGSFRRMPPPHDRNQGSQTKRERSLTQPREIGSSSYCFPQLEGSLASTAFQFSPGHFLGRMSPDEDFSAIPCNPDNVALRLADCVGRLCSFTHASLTGKRETLLPASLSRRGPPAGLGCWRPFPEDYPFMCIPNHTTPRFLHHIKSRFNSPRLNQ